MYGFIKKRLNKMTKKQELEKEREEAKENLRALCPVGTTVYTILKHVSSSGMMRHIDVFIVKDNEPIMLNWLIVRAGLHTKARNSHSLKVGGCGMDMGFSVVANLAEAIHDDYKKLDHRWF